VGPLVVAAVAIYAARLAAWTASRRQEKQLTHDSERLEKQLAKEGERQMEELAHDRVMRQREHARDALDDAIERVSDVQGLTGEIRGAINWGAEHIEELESLNREDSRADALSAGMTKAGEAIREKK
jgi:hypothetical protein